MNERLKGTVQQRVKCEPVPINKVGDSARVRMVIPLCLWSLMKSKV